MVAHERGRCSIANRVSGRLTSPLATVRGTLQRVVCAVGAGELVPQRANATTGPAMVLVMASE